MSVSRLGSIVLPEEVGLRRDHVAAADARGPDYDARYDFHTLVYDALHVPTEGRLLLYCPKLLNLAGTLGKVRIDGAPARLRRLRRFRRHDVAEFDAPAAPAELAVEVRGWRGTAPVHALETATFAGRNCLLTITRDNDLDWIADWARFHVRMQGADAALVIDNGSSGYPPEAVAERLAAVEGLQAVRVVAADLPYGPVGLRRHRHRAKFLRAGLTNLVARRFLSAARAVLVCDVDELVTSRGEERVFDAAARARRGYLVFRGSWRAPRVTAERAVRHRDHVLLVEEKPCQAKFCIVPDGALGRHQWGTHGLDGVWFSSRHLTDRFHFLHCQGISDFWKGPTSRPPGDGTYDAETDQVLAAGLGGPESPSAGSA